jgi:hypothetical protein
MKTQYGSPSAHVRSVSEKAAYSKKSRKQLAGFRTKIFGLRDSIKHAIATGSLKSSDKLEHAQRAIEVRLAMAETQLEALRKSGEEGWLDLRDDLEDAWEDLSHSINKVVAQIKDESD